MRRYVVQRVLSALPVSLGAVTFVFLVLRVLPGEPTAVLAAQSGGTARDVARLRAEYGLDEPLPIQYVRFMAGLARGDLGRSLFTHQAVSEIIVQQAPPTIILASTALAFAIGVGLPLGTIAAVKPRSWADRLCVGASAVGASVPVTLSGLILILLFSLTMHWLPATGSGTPGHLLMPTMAMGLASAGAIAQLVRAQLGEVLRQEYITVARAKGVREVSLLMRHALRNALMPATTVVGLQFGFMLSGAVATESVFARPGLGRTLIGAILYQDYPVVQGVVIVSAVLYVAVNLAVDLLHGYLDPRIHYE